MNETRDSTIQTPYVTVYIVLLKHSTCLTVVEPSRTQFKNYFQTLRTRLLLKYSDVTLAVTFVIRISIFPCNFRYMYRTYTSYPSFNKANNGRPYRTLTLSTS